jgi:ATP phosphoribosyltransferase regulatory subunit
MPSTTYAALDALLRRAGYRFVDPPILQPAALFLDLLGEDIRRRAFLTTDADGQELCLRPDFTIPVSRHHLDTAESGSIGAYAYRGPVFRTRAGESSEFQQAGFEHFGGQDTAAADAETLGLAVEASALLGLAQPDIRMGDAGLVTAVLDALALSGAWRRRIEGNLRRSRSLDADLAHLASRNPLGMIDAPAGFLGALNGADSGAARSAVADLLKIAGIRPLGGRSVDAIADRFLELAALAAGGGLSEATVAALRAFFAIEGDLDSVARTMRTFAETHALDLSEAIDLFELRTGFLAAQGVDIGRIRFATAFARRLDYYTGFVFELHNPTRPEIPHLVGGGRYDHLMSQLGSAEPIRAVGCSIWLDRFQSVSP